MLLRRYKGIFCRLALGLIRVALMLLEFMRKKDCTVERDGQPTMAATDHDCTQYELGQCMQGPAEGVVRLGVNISEHHHVEDPGGTLRREHRAKGQQCRRPRRARKLVSMLCCQTRVQKISGKIPTYGENVEPRRVASVHEGCSLIIVRKRQIGRAHV